ncbi:hypothetical protein BKA70DRAFT_519031 [Coprinopsis sp. MPI-PUGE-AT-0042]|nr:hypothetical protein BKA70DRAFT_519031 [Coprinopsis sp. MPI-PUGE-AT-0042]
MRVFRPWRPFTISTSLSVLQSGLTAPRDVKSMAGAQVITSSPSPYMYSFSKLRYTFLQNNALSRPAPILDRLVLPAEYAFQQPFE